LTTADSRKEPAVSWFWQPGIARRWRAGLNHGSARRCAGAMRPGSPAARAPTPTFAQAAGEHDQLQQTSLFIAGDLQTGQVDLAHSYARIDLNAFPSAPFRRGNTSSCWHRGAAQRLTAQQCHGISSRPRRTRAPDVARRMVRAYREFEDLYDVSVIAVTLDSRREALISRLSMQGVTYSNAMVLAKRFLGAVSWAK
jgi:hypothetical protein